MKMIKQYILATLVLIILATGISCKKRDIKGEVIHISNISLFLKSDSGQIQIPAQDTNFVKTPENITIPIEAQFSDAAPKRFNVEISVDNDTVNQLIAENKLSNTVLLQPQYYQLPPSLDVRFGLDHYDFNLVVDITAVEKNYGKNLALAIVLNNPTKDDQLDKIKKEAIIVINTSKIISKDEIHYIYFTQADSLLNIPQPGISYPQSISYLTVPVNISTGGIPAGGFNVRINDDQDTVQELINSGALQGVYPLVAGTDYLFPDSVDFPAQQSITSFNLSVNVNTLVSHYHQKVAIALSLGYPTSHLLDSSRRTLVLLLDPVKLVEFDITNVGSTFSVQRENTRTGEVSPNLVDNKINTKFLLFDFYGVWAQLEYDSPQVAGAYTLTSANDHSERDPSSWQLLASNDATNWTVLDAETNQTFTARFQTKKYYFNNKTAYKYYRLNIQQVAGGNGGLFQLAEWRLIKTP